eukprot:7879797-Pyramimonas_sp.AAC.1
MYPTLQHQYLRSHYSPNIHTIALGIYTIALSIHTMALSIHWQRYLPDGVACFAEQVPNRLGKHVAGGAVVPHKGPHRVIVERTPAEEEVNIDVIGVDAIQGADAIGAARTRPQIRR